MVAAPDGFKPVVPDLFKSEPLSTTHRQAAWYSRIPSSYAVRALAVIVGRSKLCNHLVTQEGTSRLAGKACPLTRWN